MATLAPRNFRRHAAIRNVRDNRWARVAFIIFITLLAFAFPIWDTDNAQVFTAGTAEVFILLALGLNIVVGFAGLLDLGYAAFYAIGAYVTAMLASTHFSAGTHTISNLLFTVGPNGIFVNFLALIPIAALTAAFFGIMFGAPTLRLRGDYLAIVTLGFGEIIPVLVRNTGQNNKVYLGRHGTIGLPDITGGINGLTGVESPPNINFLWIHLTFQTNDARPWYYLGLIIIVVSIFVIIRMRDSRLGRCWVAIREDEIAAAHAGISITGARLTAFAIGASFSGFAGLLDASRGGSVSFDQFLFPVSITILVMVILGGIGSIPGVIVGALLITFLTQSWIFTLSLKLNTFGDWAHKQQWAWGPFGSFSRWMATFSFVGAKQLILGIILVVMMLARPQGLIPDRRRARELRPETVGELAEENEELWTTRTGEI